MVKVRKNRFARAGLFLFCLSFAFCLFSFALASQDARPAPPADRTLIYWANAAGALAPLAFEMGATPLRLNEMARSTRVSHIELRGARSATTIANEYPRFYMFVPDEPNARPPLLVWLTPRRDARRVTAVAERGRAGFAIASADIIRPRYLTLAREGGMQFLEVTAREALMPGEYAFVGSDLTRIATFRIVIATIP